VRIEYASMLAQVLVHLQSTRQLQLPLFPRAHDVVLVSSMVVVVLGSWVFWPTQH
jgi:hypothetical protein